MIQEFIFDALLEPFNIKTNDCCHLCDRWIFENTKISPMFEYGISYDDEQGALDTIKREGGILNAVSAAMSHSGFTRTKYPSVGDIGVIFFDDRLCPAIYTGFSWFSRHKDGFVDQVNPKVLRIWKIG